MQLKGVRYRSPTSPGRALLGPHPVALDSWSLDLLPARMARFLLQEINPVKVTSWGRGKGKSYHKIVLPKSEVFVKKKGYLPPAIQKCHWRGKCAPL